MALLDQLGDGGLLTLAGLLGSVPNKYGQSGMSQPLMQMGLLAQKKQEEESARKKLLGLITPQQTPFSPDMFPGETPQVLSGQATGGLLNTTPSLLQSDPMQAYGQMMAIPGYEQIGAQGLLGTQDLQAKAGLLGLKQQTERQGKEFDYADKLRDEFTKEAGEFKKVSDAYGRVVASVDKPSAAGDMALIFNYMKMLDPGSTVREGEYATAQQATGVGPQVLNLYNRLVSGERLNPAQRQDFFGRSQMLYDASLGGLEQLEGQYTNLASRFGIDPGGVIVDFRVNRKTPDMQDTRPPVTQSVPTMGSAEQKRLEELRKRQGR